MRFLGVSTFGISLFLFASLCAGQDAAILPKPGEAVLDTSYGYIAYDLPMRALDGSEVRFSDFKDRVLFVNFWATWCAPCVRELPSIARLKDAIGDAPVEFMLISIDDGRPEVKRFLRKHDVKLSAYTRAWKRGESSFSGHAVPTTFIVNRDGEIIYRHAGAADWNSEPIRDLLLTLVDGARKP